MNYVPLLLASTFITICSNQSKSSSFFQDKQHNKHSQNKIRLVANGNENVFGVGYSIDAAKSRYLDAEDVKDGAPIFDEVWLNQTIDQQKVNHLYKTDTFAASSNSFKSLNASLATNFTLSSFLGGAIDVFTANLSRGFNNNSSMDYKFSGSKYLYALNYQYKNYEFSLPKYSSDLDQFRDHLDSIYVSDLRKVLSNQLTPSTFFEKYGTHVIAKGNFGGKAEIYYGITSNTYCLKGNIKAALDNSIKASIEGAISAGRDISFSFSNATALQNSKFNESFRAYTTGGTAFSATGINSFNSAFKSWTNSLDDKCGLIGTSKEGLIPLWNILPADLNTTANIDYLKSSFRNYTNNYANSIIDTYDPREPLYIPDHRSEPEYIQSQYNGEEYTVKYDKRVKFVKDPFLQFNLDEPGVGDYTCEYLKAYGYTKALVQLYIDIKEIDDGYQHVFLCSAYSNEEKYILKEWKYEHGPGRKETKYAQAVFNVEINLWDLNIDKNSLYFRFNASGFGNNDWMYRAPLVHVTYKLD